MLQESRAITGKVRIGWLDTLKGISVVLFVLIHTQKPEMYAFLFRPFFLTCFLFVGGYTIRNRKGYIPKQIIHTLLIVTSAIVFYAVYHRLVNHTNISADRIIGAYLQSHAVYPQYPPIIWFVPCMCMAKCIFQMTLQIANDRPKGLAALSVLLTVCGYYWCSRIKIFLPWHIQIACLVQIFLYIGYYFRNNPTSLFHREPTVILCITAIIYFMLVLRGPMAGDLALMKVSDWPRYMLCAIIGTVMMALVAQKVDSKVFRFIGRNYLIIMILQEHLIGSINKFLNTIDAAKESLSVVSLFVTALVIAMICCCVYIKDFMVKNYMKNFHNKFMQYLHEFWKYRDLLKLLVTKNIKLKYRRSWLGYVWSILNPLLIMVVMSVVFSTMFKRNIENFPVYLFCGQLLFNYMNTATTQSQFSVTGNAALLKKTYVPKYLFTLARVTSCLVDLLFSLGALVIVILVTKSKITWYALLLPFVLLQLYVFCVGLGLFLAQASVFFKDTQFIYSAVITAWMYLTPIFYPMEVLSKELAWGIQHLNPMYFYIGQFRDLVYAGRMPEAYLIVSGVIAAAAMMLLGIWSFLKTKDEFILHI